MNKRSYWHIFFGPYLAAAFFPLLVFANEAFAIGLWGWFALLCALCAAQLFLGIRFGARRLLPGLALTVLSVAGVLAAAARPGLGHGILCASLAMGQLYALWLAARTWEQISAPQYMVPALVLNLLVAFGMALSYYHDQVLLGYVAVPYLVAALFLSNRRTIKSSASMQSGLALRIVHQNFLMMIVLVAILLLLINFSAISNLVAELVRQGILLILKLIALFGGGGEESQGGGSGGAGTPDLGVLGAAEPSAFWEILSVIMQYVAMAAVVIGAGFGLYFGVRKLSRFLAASLRRFVGAYQDAFTDESQSLKTARQMRDEIVNSAGERLKKLFTRPPSWEKLSAVEKVRYAYQKTRQRARAVGIDPDPLTPRELLENKRLLLDGERALFENTYYETRYRERMPSQSELDNARAVAQTRQK